jgi:hypothetical protein
MTFRYYYFTVFILLGGLWVRTLTKPNNSWYQALPSTVNYFWCRKENPEYLTSRMIWVSLPSIRNIRNR